MTETDNNAEVEVVIHPPEPATPYDWARIHGDDPRPLPPLPPEAV